MSGKDFIKDILKKDPVVPSKQINITMDLQDVESLEKIAGLLTRETGKTITRNELFKNAVKSFIAESTEELRGQGFNLDIDDSTLFPYDTIILPAHQDGFLKAFLVENKWYPVRANDYKIMKMKYIAIYVGSPISAITHYGKIKRNGIEPDPETGYYTISLDGSAKKLEHSIPLGNIHASATRSPRYVKLETLLSADTYEDLAR